MGARNMLEKPLISLPQLSKWVDVRVSRYRSPSMIREQLKDTEALVDDQGHFSLQSHH